MEILRAACLVLLVLLLLGAAIGDVRTRIIPNLLNAAIALLAIGWWIANGLPASAIALQIGCALAMLVLFGGAFALGLMGGGDVKLIVALALWLPAESLLLMLVWMAIVGGVLTLALMIVHLSRRAQGRLEVPYGVAIVAGTLLVMANDILTIRLA